MTNQEKIKFLKKYKELDKAINQQIQELSDWHRKAVSINSPISDMPRGGGHNDTLQQAVDKICELEDEINSTIDKLQKVRNSVNNSISTVQDNSLETLLKYRYIGGLTFEQIAVNMHYSYRWVRKMHIKALSKLETAKKIINQAQKQAPQTTDQGAIYYRNKTDILRHGAAAVDAVNHYLQSLGENPLKSADNRIPTNWHKILVDQKVSYLFSFPPVFDLGGRKLGEKEKQILNEKISNLFSDQYKKLISKLGKDASNAGRVWLHYWYAMDEKSGKKAFQMAAVDALQCQAVRDEHNINMPLVALVRSYILTHENGATVRHYEVWDDKGQIAKDEDGEPVLEAVSREVDLLQLMKLKKIVHVDEDGALDKITNEIPYEARKVMLEILEQQIYVSGMGVNPNPERTGQATGSYVQFLYSLLELSGD